MNTKKLSTPNLDKLSNREREDIEKAVYWFIREFETTEHYVHQP